MKLLIVDDSELLRTRVKDLIKDIPGLEIIGEANNGIVALQLIKEKNPDFILLDVRMPELNGIGVLKKMRENGSKAIVCIFTNYPYSQYKKKCKEEGANYFFDKNMDFIEVKNLIIKLTKE